MSTSLRNLAGPRWTVLSLAVTTLVAAVDFATGPGTVLISLLMAGPLLEAVRGTPRSSAWVGAYALALGILMGFPNRMFATEDHLVLCGGVLAGGVLAAWAARVRTDAEERARAGEERLLALVENSADGMVLIDREGIVRYASQSTARLLGYAPAELLGRNGFELVHPDDRKRLEELFARCLAIPSLPVEAQYRYRHKDGSWRHLNGVAANRSEDPAEAAVVVNYRDVTNRKESEERLLEYARLLGEAQQFNEEVISGAGEGIIVYNRALRYAVCYEEGGLVRGLEVAWKRRDGSPIWVELHFHLRKDEEGWSRNTEGFVLDISDRKLTRGGTPSIQEQLARSAHGYLHRRA